MRKTILIFFTFTTIATAEHMLQLNNGSSINGDYFYVNEYSYIKTSKSVSASITLPSGTQIDAECYRPIKTKNGYQFPGKFSNNNGKVVKNKNIDVCEAILADYFTNYDK